MNDNQIDTEYRNFKSIYKNSDATKLELCDDLLSKAAFLKVELKESESDDVETTIIVDDVK